jgi:hypothetical protein
VTPADTEQQRRSPEFAEAERRRGGPVGARQLKNSEQDRRSAASRPTAASANSSGASGLGDLRRPQQPLSSPQPPRRSPVNADDADDADEEDEDGDDDEGSGTDNPTLIISVRYSVCPPKPPIL